MKRWLFAALVAACKASPAPPPPPPAPDPPPVVAKETPPPAAKPERGPLGDLEVQEVAETGRQPKGVFVSHDGKRIYTTNFGELQKKRTVSVFDADTLALVEDLDIPAETVEAAISPDDKTLYVSSFWTHSVMFFDLATKTVTHDVKVGAHPKVLALAKDGKTLYAANWSGDSVTEIDVARAEVTRTLPTGKSPRGLVVSSKGIVYAAAFYADVVEVFESDHHHRIKVCKCPRHLALSPDEKTLYVSCLFASQLHAIDLATETLVHKVAIGTSPKSIAVGADGRYVYSADYGATRSVSVVDTHDWTSKVFTVPGMDRGSGVAVAADGEHAFVTGWYDAHVYKVGFAGGGGHPDEAKKRISAWIHKPFSADPGDEKKVEAAVDPAPAPVSSE